MGAEFGDAVRARARANGNIAKPLATKSPTPVGGFAGIEFSGSIKEGPRVKRRL